MHLVIMIHSYLQTLYQPSFRRYRKTSSRSESVMKRGRLIARKRKIKRKEKQLEKKQRKRAACEGAPTGKSSALGSLNSPSSNQSPGNNERAKFTRFVHLPIAVILDCGFDEFMHEKEIKSLASQITRCYSDNHKAPFQTHLAVSSFGGTLEERFNGLLEGHHRSWKNVRFLNEDFVEAAAKAEGWMQGPRGGQLAGVFKDHHESQNPEFQTNDIVYLTSDSPNTLKELRPYSTYIIGGLVDRNRHKGMCYKKAMDRGVRTAKLPIGDYLKMSSRFVLATNHVLEIMLRWLEMGDWGEAFIKVMPKRKGGTLKESRDDEEQTSSQSMAEHERVPARGLGMDEEKCEASEAEKGEG